MKPSPAALVKQAHAIADRLYRTDRQRYKPVFESINSSVKQRKSPAMILQCVKRLADRDATDPVADPREYLGGTLRKLEQERDATRLRTGDGPSLLGDILNRAQARAKHK